MINVLINGINGKMGKETAKCILNSNKMHLLGGLDHIISHNLPYKVFTNVDEIFEKPDVIIDFSVPDATINLLPYCVKNRIPIVIATTGFNDIEINKIKDSSKFIPIYHSSNMSYEISLVSSIVCNLAKLLPESDIEILETHHNMKKDSPSGTALMLANNINLATNNKYKYNLNRHNLSKKREKNEIGFSSIRGGNIVGEHSIFFYSENETLEIKHTALSRSIFAEGALKAAEFIITKENGYFTSLV